MQFPCVDIAHAPFTFPTLVGTFAAGTAASFPVASFAFAFAFRFVSLRRRDSRRLPTAVVYRLSFPVGAGEGGGGAGGGGMARMQTTNAFYTKICKANIKKLNAAIVVVVLLLLLCELSGELEWVGQKHDGVAGKGPADCLKVSPPLALFSLSSHTQRNCQPFLLGRIQNIQYVIIFFFYTQRTRPQTRVEGRVVPGSGRSVNLCYQPHLSLSALKRK